LCAGYGKNNEWPSERCFSQSPFWPVCVYVCLCVCVSVCLCVSVSICCVCVCVCRVCVVCRSLCLCVPCSVSVSTSVSLSVSYIHTYMHTNIHTHEPVHIYTLSYIYTWGHSVEFSARKAWIFFWENISWEREIFPSGGVVYFSNKRAFTVKYGLQGISSNSSLWKRNNLSVVL